MAYLSLALDEGVSLYPAWWKQRIKCADLLQSLDCFSALGFLARGKLEFCFLGVLGLIFLYMILVFIGFRIALKAKDRAGYVIASIFTFLICFQAFINLGVVSNLLPSKGTNLPFFSHGGSSLLANIIALSIILDINRKAKYSEGVAYS